MTVIDPKYYTRPLHFARTWVRAANRSEGLTEYACAENNIDAAHLGPGPGVIGADGNRGYASPNLPKDPPGPEAYTLDPRPVSAPHPQNWSRSLRPRNDDMMLSPRVGSGQ